METILLAADPSTEVTINSDAHGDLSTSIAICAAILFVSAWLMLRGRFLKFRNRQRDDAATPMQLSTVDEAHLEHVAQTYETVRELTGQLDTRFRLLDALIRDADRAAARLEAAQRGEAPPVRADREAESCIDEIYLYADYGFSASDIASRLEVPVESVGQILGARKSPKLPGTSS